MSPISIIICSRDKNISPEFRKNIDLTIGCDYQLIIIDNSKNRYSIFEAYNSGIGQSEGEVLCFIHDDIRFHSKNWGLELLNLFEAKSEFGLIGIAGAKTKTRTASGWWDCKGENMLLNIIQHFPDGSEEHQHYGFDNSDFEEAVVIDGVFMSLKKETEFKFPTQFSGFHGYDLVLSFEILSKGYKIGVTDKVLLEHFSIGRLNSSWLHSVDEIHNLYQKSLPLKTPKGDLCGEEIKNCEKILDLCYELKEWRLFSKFWRKLLFLDTNIRLHYKVFNKLRYGTR
jgi:glycosyltransferase involved in cell wall biosynthesis